MKKMITFCIIVLFAVSVFSVAHAEEKTGDAATEAA